MVDTKTLGLTLARLEQEFFILCEKNTKKLLNQAYQAFYKDLHLLITAPLSEMIDTFNQALMTQKVFAPNSTLHAQHTNSEYQIHKQTKYLTTNLNNLIAAVFNQIHKYEKKYQLTYHTSTHAIETAQTAGFIGQHSANKKWSHWLFICGLCHDVIYTRNRVKDEKASAKFLITVLKPFLTTQKPLKKYFEALIRVLIIGGTLPIFLRKKTTNDTAPKIYQKTFIEINLAFSKKRPQNKNIKTIFSLGLALSTADVQRSLLPEAIPTYQRKFAHQIINRNSELYKICQQYFHEMHISSAIKNTFIDIVYTKLGQGIRFVSENIPCGQKALSPLQIALIKYLCAKSFNKKNIVPIITKNLEQFHAFFQNEQNFSNVNINSLRMKNITRNYAFHPESWQWHKAIYTKILQLENTNPKRYKQIVFDLLDNVKILQRLIYY